MPAAEGHLMFGYHGRYLRIDLTSGTARSVPLGERTLRRYLGGAGLGTYLLSREAPARVDPMAPAAPLLFVLSPLVGTPLTTSAKFAVVAKSPLTDRLCDALSSSHFAIAAKRAGCDAIVVTGSASEPCVIVLDNGAVRIEPASELWGLSAAETEQRLRARLGGRFHTAAIGPAGERLVRYATISHESRHAGRGGLGAVMGSKRLKALAVTGTQRVELADTNQVVALSRALSERSFGPATAKYRELGTVANLLAFNRFAALPARNFQQNTFDQAELLAGENLIAARQVARRSCAACTIGCEHVYATRNGTAGGSVRTEYESVFALGPLCGVSDPDAVLSAVRRCDELGLDTISTGASIAFAMECAERGLLDAPGLRFGRGGAMLEMIERIGNRDGLGSVLAEGTRRAAAQIGGDSADFAPHVKGLEIPGYEPRALQTMALGFAVGSRGADHNRSGAYEADFSAAADRLHGSAQSARLAIETEDRAALLDSLILCKFLRGIFTELFEESAELLRPVTGWDITGVELRETARRIVTAKKLFNIREGWTAKEDTLPRRFLSDQLPSGVAAGTKLPAKRLEEMIQAYYQGRGWTQLGEVPERLITALQLRDLVQERAELENAFELG
jgi:aldehyde:ferredoxin oxidoreductase